MTIHDRSPASVDWTQLPTRPCPVAESLDRFGDRWSILETAHCESVRGRTRTECRLTARNRALRNALIALRESGQGNEPPLHVEDATASAVATTP